MFDPSNVGTPWLVSVSVESASVGITAVPEPVSMGIPESVSMGIPEPVCVGVPEPVSTVVLDQSVGQLELTFLPDRIGICSTTTSNSNIVIMIIAITIQIRVLVIRIIAIII